MENSIRILADADDLAHAAVKRWIELADQAIAQTGNFNVALSGGSTPKKLFQLLAQPEYAKQVQWQKVHIYFGDERAVPLEHEDSNYRMAKETLLDHVPVPESQVYPIYTDLENIRESADRYAEVLRKNIANKLMREAGGFPRFDLCLQGVGDDGHTASLFPGTEVLNENERIVSEVYVEKFKSWRVSLTFPVLANSQTMIFLVAGEGKADIVQQLLKSEGEEKYPVQMLLSHIRDPRISDLQQQQPCQVEWYLDKAAASRLQAESI